MITKELEGMVRRRPKMISDKRYTEWDYLINQEQQINQTKVSINRNPPPPDMCTNSRQGYEHTLTGVLIKFRAHSSKQTCFLTKIKDPRLKEVLAALLLPLTGSWT